MLHRRDFLKTTSLALVAGALGPFVIGSASGTPMDGPSRATFAALLHTWFHNDLGGPVELVALKRGAPSRQVDQFTLVFRDATGSPLPEGIYPLTAETGERFEMFLQPAGDDASSQYYTAAFNLLRPLSLASCA
jgi:hypothetical protein